MMPRPRRSICTCCKYWGCDVKGWDGGMGGITSCEDRARNNTTLDIVGLGARPNNLEPCALALCPVGLVIGAGNWPGMWPAEGVHLSTDPSLSAEDETKLGETMGWDGMEQKKKLELFTLLKDRTS
eukprot:14851128-Ditylum_brightwellii.AAC.1